MEQGRVVLDLNFWLFCKKYKQFSFAVCIVTLWFLIQLGYKICVKTDADWISQKRISTMVASFPFFDTGDFFTLHRKLWYQC